MNHFADNNWMQICLINFHYFFSFLSFQPTSRSLPIPLPSSVKLLLIDGCQGDSGWYEISDISPNPFISPPTVKMSCPFHAHASQFIFCILSAFWLTMFHCKLNLCEHVSETVVQFIQHTKLHSNTPYYQYQCGVPDCPQTYRKATVLKTHV